MTYTYELAWEADSEYPTVYLCQDGVRIALFYEDPILQEGQDPGCEYVQAMNFIRKYL